MQKILIIQTAFIGDVVLATGIVEKLHAFYPNATIDLLIRKGNESLFTQHPFIHQVLIWNKKSHKYLNLFRTIQQIRANKYTHVINLQRYAATGLIAVFSGAKQTIGFNKNPFSLFFSKSIQHHFSKGKVPLHEIERNHQLIAAITDEFAAKPKLYPTIADQAFIREYTTTPFICIAPASVWYTTQFAKNKWIDLIQALPSRYTIYLLGAAADQGLCTDLVVTDSFMRTHNLAGKLNFLAAAALMQQAEMNYVNDSAPLHFASAVDAPVTAIYCSTIPAFGYGPLSTNSHIVAALDALPCRPCGIHGHKKCPKNHFNCAQKISTQQLLAVLTV
jgi:heptosyltransferase-2